MTGKIKEVCNEDYESSEGLAKEKLMEIVENGLDKEAVLDCISSRTSDIDFYLFKDIVGTMMTFTTYEDFIKMKNHAAYSNFLLMQYEKYDESEKNGMIDLLEEFKQEFHYAGSGRA